MDCFWFRFGADLGSQMAPQGSTRTGGLALAGVQDGVEIVLVRFSCRLVVRVPFLCPVGLDLGSFWGAPGVVLVLVGVLLGVVLVFWVLACHAMIDVR